MSDWGWLVLSFAMQIIAAILIVGEWASLAVLLFVVGWLMGFFEGRVGDTAKRVNRDSG